MAKLTFLTNLVVQILFVSAVFIFICDVLGPLNYWAAELKGFAWAPVQRSFRLALFYIFSGCLLKIVQQIELNTRRE